MFFSVFAKNKNKYAKRAINIKFRPISDVVYNCDKFIYM